MKIYVICRLGGPYSGNAQANNRFIIFPVANRLTSRFVYVTLSLNWLTCRVQTIAKNLTREQTSMTQILNKERCVKDGPVCALFNMG